MPYTVAELLRTPDLETISLIPGAGETREITWAHVCELVDPWNWLGDGALVMTTGLGIPASEAQQVAYVERSHAAGIAAVSIGENMSAPPLSPTMLERARELDFAVLETAHDKPFVALAQAVARANTLQQQERLTTGALLYESLTQHLQDTDLDPLLERFGSLLGGTFRLITNEAPNRARGVVHTVNDSVSWVPLVTPTRYALEFTRATDARPDPALLQYASAAVTTLLAVTTATHRQELTRGSFLLSRLLDQAIAEETAQELIEPHRVAAPYRVLVWPKVSSVDTIEEMVETLVGSGVRLLHIGRGLVPTVLVHDDESVFAKIDALTGHERVGASAPFAELIGAPAAVREAHHAFGAPSGLRFTRYEDTQAQSPFLSTDSAQTSSAAAVLLSPLVASDADRGTNLIETLSVFLAENRSLTRTAERLGVHRQTLYARIARIERLTASDLSSTAALADFWLALQVHLRR